MKQKKRTFNLFLYSGIIILLSLLIATFWDYLKLGDDKTLITIPIILSFGISIAGLILGISEIKIEKDRKTIIGVIGHIIIILFFVYIIIYSFKGI